MKVAVVSIVISAAFAGSVAETVQSVEEDAVSLLQHSARPIHMNVQSTDVHGKAPPPGTSERIRARRDAKQRSGRVLTAEQLEARKARRRAKRQAQREAHEASRRHFEDGGECDTCAAVCEELFQDVFKSCMISEGCRPWQKEDGNTADKCKRRCDRVGNWKREPCMRMCECDGTTASTALAQTTSHWLNGIHRCRDSEIGMISDCPTVAEEPESYAYDSIKKCSEAAVESGADTFNFYRTSKQFGKCTLKHCGSSDLRLVQAPPNPDAPAGRGSWKVFSTFCDAPPEADRGFSGQDPSSR